ncbi:carboxypeptidase-like regulatory domain-containing protein [Pedobacter gandavensis]|uniref:Carboxypeptidase-like regulatory domain-containing protein n=1 Tax=Pedobacter gandavensis TaxID=2679963 RepID=A0ABR6EVJ6_9SPHI|nr:carboxypeptidase-like regulatory domain-containing protein [Pedobacter gandavensis]MBB2149300.1 carboxypeptidase-like regulatory domain-containing protein [Pedobacter gandavensis]
MTKWLHFCSLFLLIGLSGYGQSNFNISGIIKDQQGRTIPGAGVYLSSYKTATVSNNDGQFTLTNIKPGNYDVLIEMMGYLPFSKNVIISDKSVKIDVLLKENTIQLREVVIKSDPNRQKYIKQFIDYFIGTTPNAEKCKILNPQVIQTDFDSDHNLLKVTANEFLIIENKSLGYRIKYLLEYFERDYKSNIVYYSGHPSFEELPGSKSKKKDWLKKREIAYQGSSQHFFRSLYQNSTVANGFMIYKLAKVPNKNRLPDSLINAQLKRLQRPGNNIVRIGQGGFSPLNDSVNYWMKQKSVPKTMSILNRAEILTDTLVKAMYTDLKTINFSDDLYVINTNERETPEYTDRSGYAIDRPLDIPNYQISTIHLLQAPIHFYINGGIYNPKSTLFSGFWAYEKMADTVPMDYVPLTTKK